jgi:hypothetical protein
MATNDDKALAKARRAFDARNTARDADSTYIQQAVFGSSAAATAAGDQAKAALKDEQALRAKDNPPKHRE